MAQLTNSFEGGTNTTTLTAGSGGNTGGSSGSFFDVVTATGEIVEFSTNQAAHGNLSAVVQTGTSGIANFGWSTSWGTQTNTFGRIYVYLTGAPNVSDSFIEHQSSGTFACGIQITTGQNILIQDANFATVHQMASTIPLDQWVRIEWNLVSGLSTGQIIVNYYATKDSNTATESYTSTAAQAFLASCTEVTFGWNFSHPSQPSTYIDDVGLSTTGFLGPVNTLSITTNSLPNGTQGVPYSQTVAATGGTPPYTWSITAGSLPSPLTIGSSTGTISGTPTGTGTSSFTVTVTDANSNTASKPLSITINPSSSITITNVVAGNVINDYGLDNVPYTIGTPGVNTSLLAYIGWDVAQQSYQSSGFSPAVNVTDSAGNLWRQIGISTMSTSARGAIWIADNPRQTTWVSVALTGWAYSTSYMIMEMDNVPTSMKSVALDFVKTTNNTAFTTALTTLSGTPSTTDIVFGLVANGGASGALNVPSGWTGISSVGGGLPAEATTYAMWIPSTASTVTFNPTWANSVPSSGIIVGLKQSSTIPTQSNPNMPNVVVEAAFGATPGDYTQSVDYTFDITGLTWTDISSRVFSKGDEASIQVKRGRQYENSQEETGTIEIHLDNHDGVFTYGNTSSPYYPNVIPNVPIRVTAWFNGVQYPIAMGYVEKWPQDWPDMPQWGFSTVTATDVWGPLASVTLPSAVEGDIKKDNPYAYFPTDEQYEFTTQSLTPTAAPLDANGLIAVNKAPNNNRYAAYRDGFDQAVTTGQALNLMGDQDTTLGAASYIGQEFNDNGPGMFYFDPNIPQNGTWTFTAQGSPLANNYFIIPSSSVSGVNAGDVFTASNNTGSFFTVTTFSYGAGFTNVFFTPAAGTAINNPATVTKNPAGATYEFWFLWGNTTSFSCTLFTAWGRPSNYWEANASPKSGAVITAGINTGNNSGSTQITSGFYVNGVRIDNGVFNQTTLQPQHFVMSISPGGTKCYLNGVQTATQPTMQALPQIRALSLGPARFSYDVSDLVVYNGFNYVAGHLAVYPEELTPTQISNHYTTGINGFVGVPAAGRFAQVLTWGRLGLKRGGTAWFQNYGQPEGTYISEAYGYEGTNSADVMNQLVQTEGGRCFTQGNGSVVYLYRWSLYNQASVATFGDNGSTELPFEQDTSFSVDNAFIYNQVSASQNRGPNQDFYVFQNSPASQNQYFLRSGLQYQSYSMLPFDVFDIVNWADTKYFNPVQRVVQLSVDPSKAQGKNPNMFPTVLGVELNQNVTINRRPVGGATISVTGAIQEISHDIGATYWHSTFQVSPNFPENNTLFSDVSGQNSPNNQYLSW